MTTTTDVATRRTSKHSRMAALVLMALAVAALAAGCVLDHDPRSDGSRLDAHPRVTAVSTRTQSV